MKVVGGASDAYLRTSLVGVGPSRPVDRAAAPPPAGGSPSAGAAAHVTISDEARALIAGASAPVDQAKVEGLKSKVDEGTFQVDSHAVAERLVDELA